MCDNSLEEWKSMCTKEVQKIWQTERVELRRAVMVLHVLKQEFHRIEYDLSCELNKFRQKFKEDDSKAYAELKSPSTPELCHVEPLQVHKEQESPKINKHRITRPKKRPNSPSLLNIQKENRNQLSSALKSKNLFGSSSLVPNKNKSKLTLNIRTPEHENVIDSSILVDETPDTSVAKKAKRKANLKLSYIKPNKSKVKVNTITQIFANMPSQERSTNTSSSANQSFLLNSDDETFFIPNEDKDRSKATTREDKSVLQKPKKLKLPNFQDYDKIPQPKSKSPQHVHKTESVRRKADRMKLPGWSCTLCQQYYEGLDLPDEELRKKMNACSKHRNKFKPLNETPKGYWDITMPSTQEDALDDSTIFEI